MIFRVIKVLIFGFFPLVLDYLLNILQPVSSGALDLNFGICFFKYRDPSIHFECLVENDLFELKIIQFYFALKIALLLFYGKGS